MQLSLEDEFTTEIWRFFKTGIFCALHGFHVECELLFVMIIDHRCEQKFTCRVVQCAMLVVIIRKYNEIYNPKWKPRDSTELLYFIT